MLGISLALAVHQFAPRPELMLQLLRVMFPYMLLVCLAAAMMGMLNARGHFFIPAMGATMLNVVMIASVLWLAPKFGVGLPKEQRLPVQIFALAYGVLAAGVAQAAFQLPTLWRDGFRYRWVSPWRDETVRRVVHQMIPGTIGVAAFQINVALVQRSRFWSAPANHRLVQLRRAADGTAAGHVRHFAGDVSAADAFRPGGGKKLSRIPRHAAARAVGTLIFLNLIASVLLVVLAEPIVRLLFEHGRFTAASTARAAFALMCLAPGLVAFSTVNILARAFYALGDTKTPMKISIVCLALNLILAGALLRAAAARRPGHRQHADFVPATSGCCCSRCGKNWANWKWNRCARILLPLAVAGMLAGSDCLGRLAIVGKFHRPRDHRAENRRGVCAGGNRRIGLLADGAGVQNSGGKGNDGICAGEVQTVGTTASRRPRFHSERSATGCDAVLHIKPAPPPSSSLRRTST